jgi:hypothetical protein
MPLCVATSPYCTARDWGSSDGDDEGKANGGRFFILDTNRLGVKAEEDLERIAILQENESTGRGHTAKAIVTPGVDIEFEQHWA